MKLFEFEVEVGEPVMIGGLSAFPLMGDVKERLAYLTGPEAFEASRIEVNELEPPEVSTLAITNLAEVPILLVEGEMLVGGDQNRTMNVTVLCPPHARTLVPVSCVEAGRWGSRRTVAESSRHAPGSLRAAKTVNLEPRTDNATDRRSDQGLVWEEVDRQSAMHGVQSATSALDDVQEEMEIRFAYELDRIKPVSGQIGVVCSVDGRVVGLDLFDRVDTLEKYLRGILAGHALDAHSSVPGSNPLVAIERFLAQVDGAGRKSAKGVGLGQEVLLEGAVAGIGLSYKRHLVHIAAFPAPLVGAE